jgi:hypothetical protein
VAVIAVAAVAELAVCEAVAVQLETLRLGAVARAPRFEAQLAGHYVWDNVLTQFTNLSSSSAY